LGVALLLLLPLQEDADLFSINYSALWCPKGERRLKLMWCCMCKGQPWLVVSRTTAAGGWACHALFGPVMFCL